VKVVLRGGPLDGKRVNTRRNVEKIGFPVVADLSKPENWDCTDPTRPVPRFGRLEYSRTERLEDDHVVFT
jgi:hypothetical protein